MPVYQFMAKGCHRRAKTSVFHRHCWKRIHDRQDLFQLITVDKFVHYFSAAGLLCIYKDRKNVSIVFNQ